MRKAAWAEIDIHLLYECLYSQDTLTISGIKTSLSFRGGRLPSVKRIAADAFSLTAGLLHMHL
jgi:hypothetical protein